MGDYKMTKLGLEMITEDYFNQGNTMCQGDIILDIVGDIKDLLNTNNGSNNISANEGLEGFITNYGLPELSYYSPYSLEDQNKVSALIKNCLSQFEPRLQHVSVNPVSQASTNIFHYKIKATITTKLDSCSLVIDSRINNVSKEILLTRE